MAKRKRTRTRGRSGPGPSRGGQFNRGPNRHSGHSNHYGGHRSPYPREAPVYDPAELYGLETVALSLSSATLGAPCAILA